MRALIVLSTLLLASFTQPPADRVPVVLELFTSEGCSSCPPADQLLSKLVNTQPVPGVEIIPLGMHVTYWDQLGWRDPASLKLATERQQDYSRVFGEDRVYTPQAVVDGREELIGSAEAGVRQALTKAAQQPHAQLSMAASADGDAITAQVTIDRVPAEVKEKLRAWLIVTEDDLTSVIKRGENGGRTLRHDAVVRSIAGSDLGAAGVLSLRASLKPEWKRERLHVVALLQGTKSRRIWGAAQTFLK